MRVFPKAIVLTIKSNFDVKRTYASRRGLVVRIIALGKTRIFCVNGLYTYVEKTLQWKEALKV